MRVVLILMVMAFTLFGSGETIKSLLDNVLIKNTQLALSNSSSLAKEIDKKDVNVKKLQEKFQDLVYAWKKVEATYIAGELDDDFVDIPRFIDIYNTGNENIHLQLARIVKSTESLDVELFKTSYKTINALEYMLYSSNTLSKRELEIIKRINANIHTQLKKILSAYKSHAQKLTENENFANGVLLNALIASSFKNAMWRVADGLGKSKKYKKADPKRFEYNFSQTSTKAIKAIVDAHEEMMNGSYKDFGDIALANGAKKETERIRTLIKDAKNILSNMSDKDLIGKKGENLYETLRELYLSYGLAMVDALSVTAKIVEADGD